jgi:hypothetical protein
MPILWLSDKGTKHVQLLGFLSFQFFCVKNNKKKSGIFRLLFSDEMMGSTYWFPSDRKVRKTRFTYFL